MITNDGATILNKMSVTQPAAKMLVQLAASQDAAAGDGTTTVTVVAGALLAQCGKLLARGMHPTSVADGFAAAASFAVSVLDAMGDRVDLDDRAALVRVAATSLSSKVVSQHSALLAPMAVDAVMAVRDPARPDSVDLRDVRVGESGGGERKSGEREEKRGRARARAPTPPFPPSAPQSPNSAAPSTTRSSLTASSSTSRPPSPPAARRAWRTPRSA